MIPLSWYLIAAAALFSIGLFGVLSRKNAVSILMSIELMLNAVNINLSPSGITHAASDGGAGAPQVFVAMVFIVAAAEVSVGLALVISAYRRRETAVVDEMTLLKG